MLFYITSLFHQLSTADRAISYFHYHFNIHIFTTTYRKRWTFIQVACNYRFIWQLINLKFAIMCYDRKFFLAKLAHASHHSFLRHISLFSNNRIDRNRTCDFLTYCSECSSNWNYYPLSQIKQQFIREASDFCCCFCFTWMDFFYHFRQCFTAFVAESYCYGEDLHLHMTLKTSYLSCRFQLINLLQYWLPISAHSNLLTYLNL